jgi:uncharacterized integral membrane protein (TIGR00698 family)
MNLAGGLRRIVPGITVCAAVALLAFAGGWAEERVAGRAWLEPLVLAILLGALIGNLFRLREPFEPGIQFGAKTVLEIAVALLGLSLTGQALSELGPSLLVGIPLLVVLSLIAGYAVSRLLGLGRRLSLLIATGNSICGNSAIAAVAPIIGARREEVAASISLTAIVGVIVVLALPLFGIAVGFDWTAYAVFTGLTVYAVPQVIAAAAPFGQEAIVLATLVKLARVIMLGPLTLLFAIGARRFIDRGAQDDTGERPPLLPWFVIGFAILAVVRSLGLVPAALADIVAKVSTVLTLIAMAALGLGVDARALRSVGARVALATSLSLLSVALLAILLVKGLRI